MTVTIASSPTLLPSKLLDGGGGSDAQARATEFVNGLNEARDVDDITALTDSYASDFENAEFTDEVLTQLGPDGLLRYVDLFDNFPAGYDHAALLESFSTILATSTREGDLGPEFYDGLFLDPSDPQAADRAWLVGNLLRTGDFGKDFLLQAMREITIPSMTGELDSVASAGQLETELGPMAFRTWILEAVARNPEASAIALSAWPEQLIHEDPGQLNFEPPATFFTEGFAIADIIRAGTVDLRATDPSWAEFAARAVIDRVDDLDGKVDPTISAGLADLTVEYFNDVAYAAHSPIDIPLDAQDPGRDGIEMPFEAARDLIYATSWDGTGQAKVALAMEQWVSDRRQDYGGDPLYLDSLAWERSVLQEFVRGTTAARLIDDGADLDAANQAAREGFDIAVKLIESKGGALTDIVKDNALDWLKDQLIPPTDAEAQARASEVDRIFNDRRDQFREVANDLLVDPTQLNNMLLGHTPDGEPVTVDIDPQAIIDQVEREYANAQGSAGFGMSVDADFTEPNPDGGLQIKDPADMSAAERAAFVRWMAQPEVRQVLVGAVTVGNTGGNSTNPGTGGG